MATPEIGPSRGRSSKAADYFQSVYELFQAAGTAVGSVVTRSYSIGGYEIGLSFAGSALLDSVTQALGHLQVKESSNPALTVCVWDSASTGQRMAAPPWERDDFLARGVIQGYNDERIHTAFQYGSSAVNMFDAERNLGIFWVPAADDLAYWEKGAPLRTILHWWFSRHKRQLVHAAAVGNSCGGVLIGGKGGSGKSTTALACLQAGLAYASDDYALLGLEPEPIVYSLYGSAKLDGNQLKRFPHLLSKVSNEHRLKDEKALLFVNRHYPSRVKASFPLRAILLPRVTGKPETLLIRTGMAKGLTALAPSTIFQLPGAGNETFKFLAAFVRSVPSYELALGTNLDEIPRVIEELLLGHEPAVLA